MADSGRARRHLPHSHGLPLPRKPAIGWSIAPASTLAASRSATRTTRSAGNQGAWAGTAPKPFSCTSAHATMRLRNPGHQSSVARIVAVLCLPFPVSLSLRLARGVNTWPLCTAAHALLLCTSGDNAPGTMAPTAPTTLLRLRLCRSALTAIGAGYVLVPPCPGLGQVPLLRLSCNSCPLFPPNVSREREWLAVASALPCGKDFAGMFVDGSPQTGPLWRRLSTVSELHVLPWSCP